MKKIFNLIMLVALAASFALSFSACNGGDGANENFYVFVKEDSDSEWGLIDSKGNTIFGEEFKYSPDYLGMNLMAVQEGSADVIYTVEAKPKALFDGEGFKEIGIFYDTPVAPVVVKGQRISVISTNGETKFTLDPINGQEVTTSTTGFSDGLMGIQTEEGKWGFIDQEGQLVIKCKYKDIIPFCNGKAIVINQNDRWVVIDTKGEELYKIKESYSLEGFNKYGILVKSDENRFAFVDDKGEYSKLPTSIEKVGAYNNKYIIFKKKEAEYGVMDYEGKIIIRPKYSSITIVSGGKYFLTEHKDKFTLVDKNDEKITEFEDYQLVIPINEKDMIFLASDGSYYMLVDKEGKPINKNEYRRVSLAPIIPTFGSLVDDIESDYGNIPGIISKLSAMIKDNGIEGFAPESPIRESMILQKRGTYSFYPDNSEASVYGCNFKTYVEGYQSLYTTSYSYDDGYIDVFNSNNRIEFIRIDASLSKTNWDDIRPEIESMLKSKGFSLIGDRSDDSRLVFSNRKCSVIVGGSGSSFWIKITKPIDESN